jgi:glycosyltransferase involved in cell wall biosynthesis
MRILHIGYRLPPERGGKERYIERLTHEQLLRGHQVLIAHRRGEMPDGAKRLSLTPTRASHAISRKSDVTAFAVECAHALARAGRIDVINVHGDHREALALGPVARRLGTPLIVTVHGALTSRHRLIMPWAFRHVDGFIAIGTRPTDDLLRVGIPAQRIRTMSSGLDLTHLAGFRNRSSVEPGLIVSVGSLEKVKNHTLTIGAFRKLRAVHPDARLVIVGDGAERAHLEQFAGPDSRIQFAGQISSDRVYSLVSRAQVFVLASRRFPTIGEGIPTAALEALALGTPVIVSSDASLDPIIEDHSAYRIFRSGSTGELVAHLRWVLGDEMSRLRMIERGLEAVSSLDWPLMAARIEDWYKTFIIGKTPRLPAEAP